MTRFLLLAATAFAAMSGAATAQPSAATPTKQDRIILLGTKGGPVVDLERSEPASLLVIGGTPYLIDAGAGTAHQFVAAGFPIGALRTIFITHHHLDHTAGLEPLMSLNWIGTGLRGAKGPPVEIYGPPATEFLVDAALRYLSVSERIFRAGIPSLPQSKTRFVGHDKQPGLIYSDDKVRVTAVDNSHFGHKSVGPDGKVDKSYSYRFDTLSGSVVFTGDTGPSDAVAALAKGADILVSEVLPPRVDAAPVDNSGSVRTELAAHMTLEHLTPQEVGKLAAKAGVKKLVLMHIAGFLTPQSTQVVEQEIRANYSGPLIIGKDLQSIDLAK